MNHSLHSNRRTKSSAFKTNRRSKLARCISAIAAIGMAFVSIATMCQPALPFETPSIVPANGPSAGGTEVTIIGTKFSESSAVLFGDQAASSFTIVNENVIQAVTPVHPAGAVDVVIIDDDDLVQLFASAYTFEDPPAEPAPAPTPLTIASVELPNGPVAGGSIVTIEGSAFSAATSVFFGATAATEVTFFSSRLLNARVPAGPEGPVDLRVINPNGDEAVLAGGFTYFLIPPDTGIDSDGDGLTDAIESAGYEIAIDLFGFGIGINGGNLVRRTVFSDPFDPDSDDDGLSDSAEFLLGSDARKRDTDEDGLDDAEEVNRQLTSPVSVDTDGDARGPNGDLPPNASLFDGAELVEFFDSTNNHFYGGTSPLFDDTDGDGVTDYDEFAHPFRSPLVADVPKLKVEFVGAMTMTLDIELAQGTSITDGQQYGLVESEASTSSNSNESTWENSLSFTESISASGGVAGTPPGPQFEVEVGFSATQGFTEGGSTSWTEESTEEVQNSFLQIQEEMQTQSSTINGGTVTAGIKVINEGNVAFTLQNLVISGLLIDQQARDGFRAITTLRPPVSQLTLAAFDETGVLTSTTDVGSIGGRQILDLMADPSALLLDIAAFDLLDADGRNFAFLNDITNARTATVIIDFGVDRPIETYRVATEVGRNADGTTTGITVDEILTKILTIPFETQPRTGSTDPDKPNGVQVLTKVRDVETDPVADPDGFWTVFGTAPQTGDGAVNFQDITLHATESISLVYTEDRDDDGVYKREEFMYLTSDTNPDSDGDSLGDFFEIRTGWDVLVAGQSLKHVYPDPTRPNVDQDLLDDEDEFSAGTNPKDPDTDGDGLLDGVDRCPLDPVNLPPVISLATSTDISGSEITLMGDVFERMTDAGRCDVDAIDTILIEWGDNLSDTILGMGSSDIAVNIQHIYATQNVSMITVTATDVRGEQSTADFPVSITFPTAGLLAYYPMNDSANVNNVINDAGPGNRDGSRASPFTDDTNNRFGGALGALCLSQDQVQNNGDAASGVDLPTIPVPGSESGFTISAWLIADGSPSGIIVGQPGFTGLFVNQGVYGFTIRAPNGSYHTITDPTSPPTQVADNMTCIDPPIVTNWTFYAASVRREGTDTRIRLYRGEGANWGVPNMSTVSQVAEMVIPGVVITNPNAAANWRIVGNHNAFGPVQQVSGSNDSPFEGRLDDVRVYDRALVEVELNALFNEADNSSLPGN